ncbi:MAG: helix-turn-helix domain-containing protein [Actinobacteria bacterium]|nr:helix-turn-helix domain-containing protein [Actinomycetota bacterium]
MRQEDIAAMAGTRRQTANRPLKAAEAKGAVRIGRGRVEVIDRELLRKLGR